MIKFSFARENFYFYSHTGSKENSKLVWAKAISSRLEVPLKRKVFESSQQRHMIIFGRVFNDVLI